MNDEHPVVALFDFDGTITTRDSLLPFLLYLYGFWGVVRIGLSSLPKMVKFVLGLGSRQEAKEAILTAAFRGMSPQQLAPKAESYVKTALEKLVKPVAIDKLHWHQLQGHRCVVVSASISAYLTCWVRQEAVNDLLCSELAVDAQGKYTGKLVGENCWGPEKAARILKLLGGREGYTIYAYGDSRGDKEMLELADFPFYNCWSK